MKKLIVCLFLICGCPAPNTGSGTSDGSTVADTGVDAHAVMVRDAGTDARVLLDAAVSRDACVKPDAGCRDRHRCRR